MSEARTETFHCTTCPSECLLTVTIPEHGAPEDATVSGNRCPRGEQFGRQEVTCPMRVLTSTVLLREPNGDRTLLPVRTRTAIPLSAQQDAMALVRRAQATAPVQMGDVIVSDIAGTGVDLVASCTEG